MEWNTSDYDLFNEARHRAQVDFIKKTLTKYYNQRASRGDFGVVCNDQRYLDVARLIFANSSTDGFFLITLNPPPEYQELERLQRSVRRIQSYKNFLGSMAYCYEVRAENTGLHMHILAKDEFGLNKSQVIKRCLGALKSHLGGDMVNINNSSVDVKHSTIDAYDYLCGSKDSKDKVENHKRYTLLYRIEHDLEDVYHTSGFLDLLNPDDK